MCRPQYISTGTHKDKHTYIKHFSLQLSKQFTSLVLTLSIYEFASIVVAGRHNNYITLEHV